MYDPQAPSFKLYRPKPFVPANTAKDYSDFEKFRLKQEFHSIAEKYRQKVEVAKRGTAVFFLCGILFVASGEGGASYAFVFWVAGILAWLVTFILSRKAKLYCPACEQNLENGLGTFCPGCGGEMKYSRIMNQPECQACGLRPRFGKGRRFTIKSCTYCGIKLHEEGI
jgi:hypothetical protein